MRMRPEKSVRLVCQKHTRQSIDLNCTVQQNPVELFLFKVSASMTVVDDFHIKKASVATDLPKLLKSIFQRSC